MIFRNGWRRLFLVTAATAMLAFVAAACGGDDPTPTATSPVLPTPTGTITADAAFQAEWAKLVADAEAEGEVIITVIRQAYREGAEGFMDAFPNITMEFQVGPVKNGRPFASRSTF